MGRLIILIGLVILVSGIIITLLENSSIFNKLGRLPGDILIKKGNTTIFIPITTSILLSVVLSLLFYLFRK